MKFVSFGGNSKFSHMAYFSEFEPDFQENRRKFCTILFIFIILFYKSYIRIKIFFDSLENRVRTHRNLSFPNFSKFAKLRKFDKFWTYVQNISGLVVRIFYLCPFIPRYRKKLQWLPRWLFARDIPLVVIGAAWRNPNSEKKAWILPFFPSTTSIGLRKGLDWKNGKELNLSNGGAY